MRAELTDVFLQANTPHCWIITIDSMLQLDRLITLITTSQSSMSLQVLLVIDWTDDLEASGIKDSSKEFTFANLQIQEFCGDISKWFIGSQSVHGDWKLTTYCSFAAVAGRKIFWVLWLHFKSCNFYIHVTVFTWIDPYKNIFGVFRVLSFFSSLTDLLCGFFPPQSDSVHAAKSIATL